MLPQTVQTDVKPAASLATQTPASTGQETASVRHLTPVGADVQPRQISEAPVRTASAAAAAAPAAQAQPGLVETSVLLPNEFRTVLSEDVEITGTIRATNSLVLRCQVVGDVIVTDRDGKGGTLVVDEKAKITGVVSARRVVLSGQVVGGVIGRELVEIAETARISGPVHYARMRQAEGAEVDGLLTVIRDGNDPTDRVIADLKP